MRRIDALIPKVTINLKDPLQATDDATLEVELRGDSQIQVQIECVGAGNERPGGGAAMQQLQHRRLDLDEVAAL